jgi:RNA methyltransferase, TrmH family
MRREARNRTNETGAAQEGTMTLTKAKQRELRSLVRKKKPEETRTFVVEGARLVAEALSSSYRMVELYHTADFLETEAKEQMIASARRKNVDIHQITSREMDVVSDTVHSQGVLAVLERKEFSLAEILTSSDAESRIVALDAVSDPGNLGAILRTCDWFGVQGILLGENSVDPYNPKVVRSSMGSIFHLPVVTGVHLLTGLSHARSEGYTIYVTDAAGEKHFDRVRFELKSVIVMGNEAWGASDQVKLLADVRIAIRRYGLAESLNVGVACGVVLSGIHRLYDE